MLFAVINYLRQSPCEQYEKKQVGHVLFFESVTVFSDNVKRRCGEHQHQNYYCCGIHTAKTGPNDTRRYKCTKM